MHRNCRWPCVSNRELLCFQAPQLGVREAISRTLFPPEEPLCRMRSIPHRGHSPLCCLVVLHLWLVKCSEEEKSFLMIAA